MSGSQLQNERMSASVEIITPSKAEMMLELNSGNFRRIDPHRVTRYASDMMFGRWECNGSPVIFNDNRLIDGQHRLAAVIESGASVQMLVVRGAASDGLTVDVGKPRSLADWLRHSGTPNATNISAILRNMVIYKRGLWGTSVHSLRDVPNSVYIDLAEKHAVQLQSAYSTASLAKHVAPASVLGTIGMCATSTTLPGDDVNFDWFCRRLGKGDGLEETDAVFHLRNRLLNQDRVSKLGRDVVRHLISRAWGKTVRGESCSAASLAVRMTGPTKQTIPSTLEQSGGTL